MSGQGAGLSGERRRSIPIARREGESDSLEQRMPEIFRRLTEIVEAMERRKGDAQRMEFSVERSELRMLQVQSDDKRTDKAALRIAVEMAEEGLISRLEAVRRINPASLERLLHPVLAPGLERDVLATGLPASPGAASGELVFSARRAEARGKSGHDVILARMETGPEDVRAMHAARGILTRRGGLTSHAAVIARGMGKPCVAGVSAIRIDLEAREMKVAGKRLKEGDKITIDGASGRVFSGSAPLIQPELGGHFATLMQWSDDLRRMRVRANAETVGEARAARGFGAEGIGLCRTEHMFLDEKRILAMREMILAETEQGRRKALDKLLPAQRDDFIELFEIMAGWPVTIRLLDPPLHEFLPRSSGEIERMAEAMNLKPERLRGRAEALRESNPMLGHRGCRLAISYPEIVEMQSRAIFQAVIEARKKTGRAVKPQIMVPLVGLRRELDFVKARIEEAAKEIMAESDESFTYSVGVMIELPRAALVAERIAESAEFFSFGTNDLTQSVFGISRDDAGAFLPEYEVKNIVERDPFVSLDMDGVGALIEIACERGKAGRPGLELGICGEHGGDPDSIRFCDFHGLDYVSCSPFRVPVARLAAAQAAIERQPESSPKATAPKRSRGKK